MCKILPKGTLPSPRQRGTSFHRASSRLDRRCYILARQARGHENARISSLTASAGSVVSLSATMREPARRSFSQNIREFLVGEKRSAFRLHFDP